MKKLKNKGSKMESEAKQMSVWGIWIQGGKVKDFVGLWGLRRLKSIWK